MTRISRETRETRVTVALARGGESSTDAIRTSDAFLDHMLLTLARYAGWQLEITARGDLRHHLIEDAAITLGLALADELPEACTRYGSALVAMDDALVQVAIDCGGRPWYEGPLPAKLYDHFLRSFADHARITLHVRVLRGHDRHHIVEAAFKALGLALREALRDSDAVFSTKGNVRVHRQSER